MANVKNYSKSQKPNRDEYFTPKILVDTIIEFLPKDKIIWCPFDTENSEFVIQLKNSGYNVVFSHIWNGQDFFQYEPKKWDICVSNPPFSKKLDVLKRLKKLGKPFALVFGINCLDYIIIQNYLRENLSDIQFLFQNQKMSFNGSPSSFNTSYFCWKLLPKQIIFRECLNNNSNKNFKKSKMQIEYENRREKYNE